MNAAKSEAARGFRKGDKVRVRKEHKSRYPQDSGGTVVEATSLGIACKVRFSKNRVRWIDMNHLEKQR